MATPHLNASIMRPKNLPGRPRSPQPSPLPKKQLTLFVTSQVSPSDIEKFKDAYRPVWKAVSKEPECLFFDVFQDPEVPGRFRFVEVWSKGQDWFEKEQIVKPYYAEAFEKSKPLLIGDVKIEYFEREGEASVWSDEYLAGGRKMEKTQVVG